MFNEITGWSLLIILNAFKLHFLWKRAQFYYLGRAAFLHWTSSYKILYNALISILWNNILGDNLMFLNDRKCDYEIIYILYLQMFLIFKPKNIMNFCYFICNILIVNKFKMNLPRCTYFTITWYNMTFTKACSVTFFKLVYLYLCTSSSIIQNFSK